MASVAGIETGTPLSQDDVPDATNGGRESYDPALAIDPDVAVYRMKGAFFFGAASTIGEVLDNISDTHRAFVLDLREVPFVDSSGANTIAGFVRKARKAGVAVYITGASRPVRRGLLGHGLRRQGAVFRASIDAAVADVRAGGAGAQALAKD
jgi:SulP family sulfate permease